MGVRAKRLEFEGGIREDGLLVAGPGSVPVDAGAGWTSEHLVLAALSRCSLASLRYAARREGIQVQGSAHATGVVTLREHDGVYAMVQSQVTLDVRLDPAPDPRGLPDLLARAERGCFVGKSLAAPPAYRWRVNGAEVQAAPGAL